MALQHSPSISTGSLLLLLDAANPRSYPGSGTTWFDVSGNNNHFTLFNGVAYNSSGFFTFDGVNDYAASNNNINLSVYDYVVAEIWFAGNTTTPSSIIIEHTANWNTNAGGWGVAINSNGNSDVPGSMHTNHNSEGARNYLFSIGTNWNTQVNIFSKIADSTGRLVYVNGNLLSFDAGPGYPTNTITTAGGSFANAILYLGSRGGTAAFYNGKLSVVKLYGVKLTSDQITQNFNAYRGRYGL